MTQGEIQTLAVAYSKVDDTLTAEQQAQDINAFSQGYMTGAKDAVIDLMFLWRLGKISPAMANQEIIKTLFNTPKRK